MTTISRIATAALLIVAASCGGSGGSGGSGVTAPPPPPPPPPADCTPGGSTVCLEPTNSFNPTTVTISAGGTVSFNNGSGVTHNVTFDTDGSPANVDDFSSGIKTVTFPNKGTFAYHCTIHGTSMSGQVVVQ